MRLLNQERNCSASGSRTAIEDCVLRDEKALGGGKAKGSASRAERNSLVVGGVCICLLMGEGRREEGGLRTGEEQVILCFVFQLTPYSGDTGATRVYEVSYGLDTMHVVSLITHLFQWSVVSVDAKSCVA